MYYKSFTNVRCDGRACCYINDEGEEMRVEKNPLEAKDGDTFNVIEIGLDGAVKGVIYVPYKEDDFEEIERLSFGLHNCGLRGSLDFRSFEEAAMDALKRYPVLARAVTLPEVRDGVVGRKATLNFPEYKRLFKFAVDEGMMFSLRCELDNTIFHTRMGEKFSQEDNLKSIQRKKPETPRPRM